jgi:N-acetylglutamate synthase-like GNAT family acetyltransferase
MRLARNQDLAAILALQAEEVPSPEHRVSRADLQIAIRCSTVLVVEREGAVVAWGAATPEGRNWRIQGIVVHHDHRRQGLGSMLVDGLVALAPTSTKFVVAAPLTLEGGGLLVDRGFVLVAGQLYREPERPARRSA